MMNNENLENMELNLEELDAVSGGKGSKQYVKATASVNIRKGPGLDYEKMGSITAGECLSYLNSTKKDDRGVKWYKVNFNGKVGWISSRYSKLI